MSKRQKGGNFYALRVPGAKWQCITCGRSGTGSVNLCPRCGSAAIRRITRR